MAVDPRDPDASLVATFRNDASNYNPAKSAQAGRPIFDEREVVDIRAAGSRDYTTQPATAFCDWVIDPYSGAQKGRTYAERFNKQYLQFKSHQEQTKEGTPLEYVPFIMAGKRAELKALNVYTIEALAAIDGQELKNLGPYGRDLKNKAIEYLENARTNVAPSMQLQAELEAERAKNQVLADDNAALARRVAEVAAAAKNNHERELHGLDEPETSGNAMLDAMSDTQLKDYIGATTGARPVGNPARKTLLRMAMEMKPRQQPAA
jgi:hypothetical protein